MKGKVFFKKFLLYVITVSMLFSLFSGTSFAAPKEQVVELYKNNYLAADETNEIPIGLTEYLTREIKKCTETINISSFNIKPKDIQMVAQVISYDIPEAFHLSGSFSYTQDGRKLVGITLHYQYTKTEFNEMLEEIEQKSKKLLQGLNSNKLTDLEKALILHDRIALICEYDYENYLKNAVPDISFTMYGALVNGVAVCQGYTHAYNYLLNKLGIKSESCPSEELKHIWNIVYINNKPYHVDITFDDPVWDVSGRVYHTYFLNSTQYLKSVNDTHEASDYSTLPKDTTYDNSSVAFWKNVNSAFVLSNDEIYYIDSQSKSVKRYGTNTSVYNITTTWWASANGAFWPNVYSRLATDGTNLLISLDKGIYKINTSTGKTKEVYEPELERFENIYGFTLIDGYLVYETNTPMAGPNYDINTKKNYQNWQEYVINPLDNPKYIPGDVDATGGVNLGDVVVLARLVAGWEVNYNSYALDVNLDDEVNLNDVVLLAQGVAGWSGITLH